MDHQISTPRGRDFDAVGNVGISQREMLKIIQDLFISPKYKIVCV